MSVPKHKRHESYVEFLSNAYEILSFTIKQCVKFPKRYTFFLSNYIVKFADEALEKTIKANSIMPRNKIELQNRIDFLNEAIGACNNMIPRIKFAKETFTITDGVMIRWMEMLDKELNLLVGVIKSDRERYKELPDA